MLKQKRIIAISALLAFFFSVQCYGIAKNMTPRNSKNYLLLSDKEILEAVNEGNSDNGCDDDAYYLTPEFNSTGIDLSNHIDGNGVLFSTPFNEIKQHSYANNDPSCGETYGFSDGKKLYNKYDKRNIQMTITLSRRNSEFQNNFIVFLMQNGKMIQPSKFTEKNDSMNLGTRKQSKIVYNAYVEVYFPLDKVDTTKPAELTVALTTTLKQKAVFKVDFNKYK